MTSTLGQLNAEYDAALEAASLTMRALAKAEDEHKIAMDLYREAARQRHLVRTADARQRSKDSRNAPPMSNVHD